MTKIEHLKIAHERGYRVHPDGSVTNRWGQPVRLREKKDRRPGTRTPYVRFSLRLEGRTVDVFVHRFAAWQKWGREIDGKQVRHLDENSLNNEISNLALGTPSQNYMDQSPEKRSLRASRANRKRDPELVERIRADRAAGFTYPQLVKKYGLAKSSLWEAVNRNYVGGERIRPVGDSRARA